MNAYIRHLAAVGVMATIVVVLLSVPFYALHAQTPSPNPQGTAGGGGGGSGGGGAGSGGGGDGSGGGGGPEPSAYLSSLYAWFLGLAGIASLFALVRGGLMYMFEGASIAAAGEAKKHIKNGVLVLLIAATSYVLLNAINPDLVTRGFDISGLTDRALRSVGL